MKIVASLDRRFAPAVSNSERYLRVQVIAPERTMQSRLPLNLALVIDRSGSMSGSKLKKAKEAAVFCVRNLTASDRVAVVAYDDEVRVVSPSSKLSPDAKARLVREIEAIQTGGSTNLGGGWLTGAQEVANNMHEAGYLNRTILLSDGLANVGIVDTAELSHHASELRQRGVSTTTMGIGADFNEELMEQIAIKGGGHFYFIEDARQIPDFLHRELGEVLATVARELKLEVRMPGAIEAKLLNSFESTLSDGLLTVRLDDLISGETRSVVLKMTLPAQPIGSMLTFDTSLSYRDVETGLTSSLNSREATITFAPESEVNNEQPNASVAEDAALLEVAAAREEALKMDAAGDYAGSSKRLRSAAYYLQSVAPASPAAMAEVQALEQESQVAEGGFDAMTRKAVHYAQSVTRQSRKR
ncbi:MAG: Ca-activated chloride channel [Chloroflexia bacterium]|nr:Ca-activated chloride channel [Chloroflexia bacterium]